MKNIFIILIMLSATILPAQDKIDRLVEQQATTNAKIDKLTEQITETNKQVAIIATKVDGIDKRIDTLEKSIDKRFEMQSNFMIFIMSLLGVLIVAIFGFVGFIL